MDEEMAARVLNEHVNRLVTAKLRSMTSFLAGIEFAIVHMVNLLDRQGVLSRELAAGSLRATGASLPPDAPQEVRLVLEQIARGIEASELDANAGAKTPEGLRSLFHVIQGGIQDQDKPEQS